MPNWQILFAQYLEHTPKPIQTRQAVAVRRGQLCANKAGAQLMKDYDFTLTFSLPEPVVVDDEVLDRLYVEGCDDAVVGFGAAGRIALMFARAGETAASAMLSAIQDVSRAVPVCKLTEAQPDFGGRSDIANFVGVSRQNMRKLMLTHRSTFPVAVHEGSTAIWHLTDVLNWFQKYQNRSLDPTIAEVAAVSMRLNLARQLGEEPGSPAATVSV